MTRHHDARDSFALFLQSPTAAHASAYAYFCRRSYAYTYVGIYSHTPAVSSPATLTTSAYYAYWRIALLPIPPK